MITGSTPPAESVQAPHSTAQIATSVLLVLAPILFRLTNGLFDAVGFLVIDTNADKMPPEGVALLTA